MLGDSKYIREVGKKVVEMAKEDIAKKLYILWKELDSIKETQERIQKAGRRLGARKELADSYNSILRRVKEAVAAESQFASQLEELKEHTGQGPFPAQISHEVLLRLDRLSAIVSSIILLYFPEDEKYKVPEEDRKKIGFRPKPQ